MSGVTLETVQWSSLADIDEVEPLNDKDQTVLAEIQQVLRRHGKEARFGVCLLHKHFDLNDDEVAVEYTDPKQRVSKIVVENRDLAAGNAVQTVWRFQQKGPTMATVCIRRCGKTGMTHSTVHERRGV